VARHQVRWDPPPHTKAKHQLLRAYLDAWFPKMAYGLGRSGRLQLNYLDAFAGPGIYSDNSPGSPIVALKSLVENPSFPNWRNVTFFFLFVDEDREVIESLSNEVDTFWKDRVEGQPTNVRVAIELKTFEELTTGLKATNLRTGRPIQPTFAFVDPFGFADMPIPTLCEVLGQGRCEVFFSFMYEWINRFATKDDDALQVQFEKLFGSSRHRDVRGLSPDQRRTLLHELCNEVFLEVGKFDFVRQFEMQGDRNSTLYTLLFATNSKDGVHVMKNAMWKVDPVRGLRFADWDSGHPVLFEGEPDYAELRRIVRAKFANQEISVNDLLDFVRIHSTYREEFLREHVLRPFETSNAITVETNGAPRRGRSYKPEYMIKFI